jgi:hypothetical protein
MPTRCAATTPERLRWDCGDSAVSETQAREAGFGGGTAVRCPLDGLSEGGGRRHAILDGLVALAERDHEIDEPTAQQRPALLHERAVAVVRAVVEVLAAV